VKSKVFCDIRGEIPRLGRNMSPPYPESKKQGEQGTRKIRQEAGLLASANMFFGLFFHPKDGRDILLRNVWLCQNYTVLQSRRP
jgi:hypothetical protein